MKYRLWMLPAVAMGCGLSTGAMANDGTLSYAELDGLLGKAEQYGFSRYEKLDVDRDDNVLEVEGWRNDGWELDVSMQLDDASLTRESQRRSSVPDWSLTGDQLRQALSLAQARGMQRFDELEVDSNGHVEIEGYDANQRDLDLDLRRDALTATGETR
ncbi:MULTISPECIES: hypothetical protein [Salinicola]|uniref:hypothetical protein n=1 Tax=Salinicola TaxID=404432 RepID=UPI000D09CCE3|nr:MULTISPECIES: hypothetical protein [Salinicola]MCE3026542.1 hypothetical protein [Salinicola sp. DM10]WIX31751.1 hypothetical protein QO259_13140 [Salinicola sp. JS01]